MTADAAGAHAHAVAEVLRELLEVPDASLVVFRRGAIVEMKTELLRGLVTLREDDGFRSWQIGAFEGHHCHLDLAAVGRVSFEAEPVPCQGGRPNYSAWFLVDGDCGNPHRPDGLFSVTLNRPYETDGSERACVIDHLYVAFRRVRALPFVDATGAFAARAGAP
ncbi:MAG: hypothetical protein GC151_02030 [Betaproteobacteria bacterium]|nr:hypothetical protein [Betaproteobacteria bacterium]